jgi:hypothetical protein
MKRAVAYLNFMSESSGATMRLLYVSDGQLLATMISPDQNDWIPAPPDKFPNGSIYSGREYIRRFNSNNNTYDLAPVEFFSSISTIRACLILSANSSVGHFFNCPTAFPRD